MARQKEFEPTTALDQALDVFWRQGYEATSMHDLMAHTGLAKASLYTTFGSKHDFYLAALDRYGAVTAEALERYRISTDSAIDVLEQLLRDIARGLSGPSRLRGCFAVNTVTEIPHDGEAVTRVERIWESLHTLLVALIARGQQEGDVAAGLSPRDAADFLLTTLQGMRVVAKAEPKPERLRATVDGALRSMRG